jgi:hypothetical protein
MTKFPRPVLSQQDLKVAAFHDLSVELGHIHRKLNNCFAHSLPRKAYRQVYPLDDD